MNLIMDKIMKQFGKKKALNSFSANLERGVYGLLGTNGAGKTTLINIIVGILQPDIGEVKFNEVNIQKLGVNYLDKIGYLPQNPRFYKNFKAGEFLFYMCAIKGISKADSETRTEEVLKMVNLWEERNKKVGAFSGGMKQRLGIAQALLNDPDIIILDEPTAGLDPKERIRFRNIISKLSSTKIILLATHIVSDIEYIAKEVILIKDGNIVKQDKPTNLLNNMREKVWSVNVNKIQMANMLEKYSISNAVFENEMYTLRIISDDKPTNEAVNINPNLEDVYIYYFKEKIV
ncbi:ABC transporter ATP-binding protein [Clostridium sp. MB40-C1]|uniref:ABC transporter ATP-binding protein n=1 Tax=Clostridium sp. MB40-C1 TaxID=3070996 RepID=UPI0027E1A85A|nr:ABC transporter ATP-binding protein [Clostridium sp. MB40-C1]WMJ80050.1 ABC transporter ATP-binding protein [Clostridium sp. MB40-C1]